MLGSLRVLRPINLFFLAMAMGGLIGFGHFLRYGLPIYDIANFWIGVLLILTVCAVAASGYLINDIHDVETDQINKPNQTFIGTSISESQAKVMYFALLIDGLILSAILYYFTQKSGLILVVVATQMLLHIYAKYLKKTLLWGNLTVAALTAFPYFLVAYVFEFGRLERAAILVVLTMSISAFVLNFIREVVKDWQDAKGDEVISAQTFILRFGNSGTKTLLNFLLLLSMAIHAIMVYLWSIDYYFWSFIRLQWPLILLVLLHLLFIVSLNRTNFSAARMSQGLKILMFFGVLWVYYLWYLVRMG